MANILIVEDDRTTNNLISLTLLPQSYTPVYSFS